MKKEIHKEKLELKEVSIENDVPFSTINCPSCKEQVTSDHMDLAKAVAKCGSCHVVFPIQDTLASLVPEAKEKQKPLLQPKGVDVFEFKNQVDITVSSQGSWYDLVVFFLILIVPLFSVVLLIAALKNGHFPMSLLAGGFMLNAYLFYHMFVVRKRCKVLFNINQNTLDVEQRPSYWVKDKSYDRESIEQIYVKPGYSGLIAIIKDNGERKHVPILKSYLNPSPVILKYLETTLEKHLGIEDAKYG